MSHLNYFIRYDKGINHHEDHLTRAFLVLLRFSNSVLTQFNEHIKTQLSNEFSELFFKLNIEDVNFETQKKKLPQAYNYISILLTNQTITVKNKIKKIDRKAVYDGIINFGGDLVLFIENKPLNSKVWENQLCPAFNDIPRGSRLFNKPVIIEWKEIINILHNINNSKFSNYYEKTIINDFFEFVNINFDYLNPFNSLDKCESVYLAEKRVEQIVIEVAQNFEKVKYHRNWGHFIELEFEEVTNIALQLTVNDKNEWTELTIAVDFGSTVSQARNFYKSVKTYDKIRNAKSFKAYGNLHLAFRNTNLLYFESDESLTEKYFQYWKSGPGLESYGGIKKELLTKLIAKYKKDGVINIDYSKDKEFKSSIISKEYSRINVCPAIYMEYKIAKLEAMKMDKSNDLVKHIREKMNEVLEIVNTSQKPVFLDKKNKRNST